MTAAADPVPGPPASGENGREQFLRLDLNPEGPPAAAGAAPAGRVRLHMAAGTPARIAARVLKRGVGLHGQPRWVAALTPLSVDGMIVEQRPHHIGIGRTYAVRTGH